MIHRRPPVPEPTEDPKSRTPQLWTLISSIIWCHIVENPQFWTPIFLWWGAGALGVQVRGRVWGARPRGPVARGQRENGTTGFLRIVTNGMAPTVLKGLE